MIVAESRFRVANGMEHDVRAAFVARPGFVDDAAGFLGMEVFQASDDATVFHLVTRWADRPSYETWHRSDAHRASHAFMPKGLKLDASYTRVTVMDRIQTGEPPTLGAAIVDAAPAFGRWFEEAGTSCAALLSADALTCTPNQALAARLDMSGASAPLARLLANDEADELAEKIGALRCAGRRGIEEDLLLNFVSAAHSPFTLRCRLDVQPEYVLLFGEATDREEDRLRDQLIRTNNQLAVLAREREQQRQELATAHAALGVSHSELTAAHEELDSSNWHIRQTQGVLPMCMECGNVRADEATWQTAREFLVANALRPFVSHGYCPPCSEQMLRQLDQDGEVDE